jgi:hypothetical protein
MRGENPGGVFHAPKSAGGIDLRTDWIRISKAGHLRREFHIFSDTELTRIVKTSIFCEIRFVLQKAKEWFWCGILIAAPWA